MEDEVWPGERGHVSAGVRRRLGEQSRVGDDDRQRVQGKKTSDRRDFRGVSPSTKPGEPGEQQSHDADERKLDGKVGHEFERGEPFQANQIDDLGAEGDAESQRCEEREEASKDA